MTMITNQHRRDYLGGRILQLEVELYSHATTLAEDQADPHGTPEGREQISKTIQSLEARLVALRKILDDVPADQPADPPDGDA